MGIFSTTLPLAASAAEVIVNEDIGGGVKRTARIAFDDFRTFIASDLFEGDISIEGQFNATSFHSNKTITAVPDDLGGGQHAVNAWVIDGDNVDAGSAFIIGGERRHVFGGSSVKGGRIAGYDFLANTAPTNSSNTNRNYTAHVGSVYTAVGDGGTNTGAGARGGFFGSNPYTYLDAGAVNVFDAAASEMDLTIKTGASSRYARVLSIVGFNEVRGTDLDAAISISGGTGHIGFNIGIAWTDINRGSTENPFHSGSTLMGSYFIGTPPTITNGIDVSGFGAITGNAWKSPGGFRIAGDGASMTLGDSSGLAEIKVNGASSNASILLIPKGTGAVAAYNASLGPIAVFSNDAGATVNTNSYNFHNAPASGIPISVVEGVDTNISWAFRTKGSGSFLWQTAGAAELMTLDTTGSLKIVGNLGIGTAPVSSTRLALAAGTTALSPVRWIQGAAPTSPVDGDMWREDNTNTGLKLRVNGVTKTVTLS